MRPWTLRIHTCCPNFSIWQPLFIDQKKVQSKLYNTMKDVNQAAQAMKEEVIQVSYHIVVLTHSSPLKRKIKFIFCDRKANLIEIKWNSYADYSVVSKYTLTKIWMTSSTVVTYSSVRFSTWNPWRTSFRIYHQQSESVSTLLTTHEINGYIECDTSR